MSNCPEFIITAQASLNAPSAGLEAGTQHCVTGGCKPSRTVLHKFVHSRLLGLGLKPPLSREIPQHFKLQAELS